MIEEPEEMEPDFVDDQEELDQLIEECEHLVETPHHKDSVLAPDHTQLILRVAKLLRELQVRFYGHGHDFEPGDDGTTISIGEPMPR